MRRVLLLLWFFGCENSTDDVLVPLEHPCEAAKTVYTTAAPAPWCAQGFRWLDPMDENNFNCVPVDGEPCARNMRHTECNLRAAARWMWLDSELRGVSSW